ncbi:MAG: glycosyltransferase [Lachnospiraceae bacterium]|nr:glycosyltransferase [Lachnospiraceae bacterium]MDE7238124.1 glycosyltransferase [Lachnospiraceae bacterium]
MLFSICIYTYNQIEILRKNISEIVKYPGDDIEIVVSDNCSTDPIREMLLSFHDSRIKYYRTTENRGIDGNILNALRCCKGEYIFLFRTKDQIIAEKIDDVLRTIKSHPSAAFFLFSAKDEQNKIRMKLKNKVFLQGRDAETMHNKLLVHPSGQIYKRSCLRLELYEKYINQYFSRPISSIVHQLIRMDLAEQGDFVTSSCMAWRYAYTMNTKEKAVYTTGSDISIYAPCHQYLMYQCEMDFVDREFSDNGAKNFLKILIERYIRVVTVKFMYINRNEEMNAHYQTKSIAFHPYGELISFSKQTLMMIKRMKYENKSELRKWLVRQIYQVGLKEIPRMYLEQKKDKKAK